MIRCYITDRRSLPPGVELEDVVARSLQAGVDWIQLREKDLSARELLLLAQRLLALSNPHGTRLLINSRVDVALAAGAYGVHLPSDSPAPQMWPLPKLTWGVSCHSVDEVRQAEADGANYVVFGPVFSPLSKSSSLAPHGLHGLERAARAVRIPVLALGGITAANSRQCAEHGAAGVAGITLFQDPANHLC